MHACMARGAVAWRQLIKSGQLAAVVAPLLILSESEHQIKMPQKRPTPEDDFAPKAKRTIKRSSRLLSLPSGAVTTRIGTYLHARDPIIWA